ncbi:MOSC domain-containing protein [Solicola gregarius]|uniref:MOSC domain-containing protein n=1 Tax=Solicola gregarius TaxID=2908642 RepID=A0AA46TJ79_9ACTN|nr:MOSC N-terminal beta barrel domain-containing protein [Solicola gregarius]UYM05852.1 MOSC domain-containing protein [Solicola gregarius]
MRVASLHVYPVKSMAGMAVESTEVCPGGLRDDRRWMVVDASGHKLTARERHRLLHALPEPDGTGGLKLSYRDGSLPPLLVPRPDHAPDVATDLSRLTTATSSTPEADAWVSEVVEEQARLVRLDDPARRPIGASHGGLPGEPLSLADAGPVHLATEASMARLNDWLTASDESGIPIGRFRPNIVVAGDIEPFAEDAWRRVRIGGVTFRFGEHCDRCVLPTIDADTLTGSKEPTRTLARHRRWDGKVWFGIRLIPETYGPLRSGDQIEPLEVATVDSAS